MYADGLTDSFTKGKLSEFNAVLSLSPYLSLCLSPSLVYVLIGVTYAEQLNQFALFTVNLDFMRTFISSTAPSSYSALLCRYYRLETNNMTCILCPGFVLDCPGEGKRIN